MTDRNPIFPAEELCIGDIGSLFRSEVYRDNNKTSLPIGQSRFRGRPSSPVRGEARLEEWRLQTIYAHENGNIKINNGYHLRPGTMIEQIGGKNHD